MFEALLPSLNFSVARIAAYHAGKRWARHQRAPLRFSRHYHHAHTRLFFTSVLIFTDSKNGQCSDGIEDSATFTSSRRSN